MSSLRWAPETRKGVNYCFCPTQLRRGFGSIRNDGKIRQASTRTPLTTDELERLTADDFTRLKLTDDEKSRLREISKARERERMVRSVRLRAEEEPILSDLRVAGWNVNSVWDLVNASARYAEIIPILLKHLKLLYSDRTKEGIARALAVPDASDAWPILVAEYRKAPIGYENGIRLGAKDGLAAALSATATDAVMDELVALANDRSQGDSRLLLLRRLRKSKTPITRRASEELASEPALSKEIASQKRAR
jgi:hypothetical protein